jgi:hypothetical protein
MFAGWVVDRHRVGTVIDWREVWKVPELACVVLLIAFVVLFKPPGKDSEVRIRDSGKKQLPEQGSAS